MSVPANWIQLRGEIGERHAIEKIDLILLVARLVMGR
jgi:hypothetical protein